MEVPEKSGVSGSEEKTPEPKSSTSPIPPTAKIEMKDGKVFVDGKGYVLESDLIAAKRSLESAAEKAQAAHNQAIDGVRLELSAAQQTVADLNAKLKEAQEKAPGQGATEEVASIKLQLDEANKKVETLTTDAGRSLELKRQLLKVQYPGVTDEQLANKSMKELDSFEEALKAVTSARGGVGSYAVGGGTGSAAPMSDYDRRKKVLEATPIRGARTAETG